MFLLDKAARNLNILIFDEYRCDDSGLFQRYNLWF